MGNVPVSPVALSPILRPASERSNVYGFDPRFCSGGELLFFALLNGEEFFESR